MNGFSNFTRIYPIQKTLRFELVPQGKTMEHFRNSGFLEDDREKADKYALLKKVIDKYHKKFINESLSSVSLNWRPLEEAMERYRRSREEKDKKALESEQKRMREEIVSFFENDGRFENLFSEKLFSKLLPGFITCELMEMCENADDPDSKAILDFIRNGGDLKDAIDRFNRFSGYFIGFHENRKNIYSKQDETTAISNRIVNENFPIFLDNSNTYEKVRKEIREVIKQAEDELAPYGIKMDEIFSLSSFDTVLTQDGIDRYNLAIGGSSPNDHKKLRGFNEFLNLYRQRNQTKEKIRMTPLRKQILSDRTSFSYIPQAFGNDTELLFSLNLLFRELENDEIFERALDLISSYSEFETTKIHVKQADLNNMSVALFDRWDKLGGLLRIFKANSIGDSNIEKTSKIVDKWLNSKEFTLSDIISALSISEKTFDEYVKKMSTLKLNIDLAKKVLGSFSEKISGNADAVEAVKDLLDSVLKFQQMLRPFDTRRELQRDTTFYTEFDMIRDKLFAVIPLYNRTRNYLTVKKFNTKKIKLNFKNPTLAHGWDLNKEKDNTAVILRREEKYYLGIMDPRKKRDIVFNESTDSGPCYQKMEYKLLPGPNKMLPKVFFSEKHMSRYDPSGEIHKEYLTGKHKKGDNFDLTFCHKLIDFFKESLKKHEDWKVFDFKFSRTESYNDISEFYKEVLAQGYKLTFKNISANIIDKYVEKGNMFLFQIYNKDFAEGTKGRKNMHTMYWNAAFSEENLEDVVIKLNGEAELFYRDKSNIEKIVHKKGTMLVNRTYTDGKPLPDRIHKEISDYYSGKKGELSSDAKKQIDKTRAFEAHYDIIKDRRYLEDKVHFHIPLTLNFKAGEEKEINRMVIEKFINDKDTHIIGIDRGEKNLIYVSVINRKGEIVYQESFNEMGGFDYHEKLDQREKERQEARRNWNTIGKIKDLKEGYLSQAVHKISEMVIKYNAIVVLEDLNYGFKRGRFKVEKQIYQKFEKALIDKLNYLAFKNITPTKETGGILNAYQLTNPFESFTKIGKQTGILFYVNPAYTSKIDPTTGFADLFNVSDITNAKGRKDFLQRFDSISSEDNLFIFTFRYSNFNTSKTDYKNKWSVYTNGERIKYDTKEKHYYTTDPTKEISDALSFSGIKYAYGENILDKILQTNDDNLISKIYFSFLDTIRMRNSDGDKDYIISPVKNRMGEFFTTDQNRTDIPKDSDANGAYNIALKGKLMLQMIAENYDSEKKLNIPRMEHATWFKFMQTRGEQ